MYSLVLRQTLRSFVLFLLLLSRKVDLFWLHLAYPTEIYNISIPFHYPLEICKFVYCPIIDTILFHLANALDLTLCKMMCATFSVIDFFIDTQKSQCAHSMLNFKKKGGGRLYHRLYLYIHIELIATCAAVTIQSLTPGHSILIPPPSRFKRLQRCRRCRRIDKGEGWCGMERLLLYPQRQQHTPRWPF